MATNVEIKGSQFVYGFQTTDAPTIAHFFARKAVLKYEPETFVTATDGEGQTESVALSKADKRMITGTLDDSSPAIDFYACHRDRCIRISSRL